MYFSNVIVIVVDHQVSFREGDLITDASAIDEGWMTGRVHRTGRAGMLPANYVEPAPLSALRHLDWIPNNPLA